jgi:alpha-L-arabinofuranosidase
MPSTLKTTLTLDNDFELSPLDPNVFGGFAEHLGRHIYTGIYEPGHATADEEGFRKDVIALVKELNMPVIRYPGGNFVSGYNWEDGVGPKENRPFKLDLAWGAGEPNTFGTNEFMSWCDKVGTKAMMAVNLGTRGPEEARNLLEYCNHPGGSYWSDLRKSHGYDKPYGIEYWCLGNEMDGPWQMGAKTAFEYGRIANETAKLLKWIDPKVKTILCGSSSRSMATFGKWEWESLHECYDNVDYVSMHTYYGNRDGDIPKYLAEPDNMGAFIRETAAVCDAVGAAKKSKKKLSLSFDEWNVWYHSGDWNSKSEPWTVARPQLEDIYDMADVLLVGGMLIEMMNHCDRVKVACIAQVVNVIAPIMTEPGGPAWKQTIFHPFAQASNLGRGTVLRQAVNAPELDGRRLFSSTATRSDDGQFVTIFAINRSVDTPMELSTTLRAFGKLTLDSHTQIRHDDLAATNTKDNPNNVTPSIVSGTSVSGEVLSATLAPASWTVIRVKVG